MRKISLVITSSCRYDPFKLMCYILRFQGVFIVKGTKFVWGLLKLTTLLKCLLLLSHQNKPTLRREKIAWFVWHAQMRPYAQAWTPTPVMCRGGLAAKDTRVRVLFVIGCGCLGHYVMLTPYTLVAGEREDVMVWFRVHLQWSSFWHYSANSSDERCNEGMCLFLQLVCDLDC